MTHDRLLQETVALISNVLKHPTHYYELPIAAEAFTIGLLGIANAIETGNSLGTSLWRTWEGINILTEEISVNRELRRHLCNEQIMPERIDSYAMLMKRGTALCTRLLQSWDENTYTEPVRKHF